MKDKILLDDIKDKSLNELTELANNIIENLENKKNLEDSVEEYQKLIKLNGLIEKNFKKHLKKYLNQRKIKFKKS